MEQGAERPSVALLHLLNGYQVTQAIAVAAALGLADCLVDGPRTGDDLAAATDTHPPTLYRLLRTLASIGVFHEEDGRRFSLTPLGDCLRSDAPEPVAGIAAYRGSRAHWQAWGDLLHSVKTGENAFRHVHGMENWEYRARNPEEGAIFDRAMTTNARRNTEAILTAYDFGQFTRVVDVGGGQGALLAGILARHTGVRGVLFDQPHVIASAERVLRDAGVTGRCEVIGGDFFRALPEGGDAYVLRLILHDWADAEATAILETCHRAIAPDGRLLVMERVIAPPNEGRDAKLADLNMLVGQTGRERTREEYTALFAGAGFTLTRVIPTAMDTCVIEGVPV